MNEAFFQKFGRSSTVSGGTRNPIKLSRPWQKPLSEIINPGKCQFCTIRKEEESLIQDLPKGWRLLQNNHTPHKNHRLIIPTTCWNSEEKLQKLGGFLKIANALKIASMATAGGKAEVSVFAHIGQSAGQNLGHLHWHLKEEKIQTAFPAQDFTDDLLVFESQFSETYAGGVRAGQLITVLNDQTMPFDHFIWELAARIWELVDICNKKFKSAQGLPPEYSVSARISADGYFRYASYCPILNHWGATEYVFAPLEGSPFTLPWPHSVTAEYLRQ